MREETKPPIRERLRSALTRDLPKPPETPVQTFSAWTEPDPARLPNEADARAAGAAAWANREIPEVRYGRNDL